MARTYLETRWEFFSETSHVKGEAKDTVINIVSRDTLHELQAACGYNKNCFQVSGWKLPGII